MARPLVPVLAILLGAALVALVWSGAEPPPAEPDADARLTAEPPPRQPDLRAVPLLSVSRTVRVLVCVQGGYRQAGVLVGLRAADETADQARTARTDEGGVATFGGVGAGSHVVWAVRDGCRPGVLAIGDELQDPEVIVLRPGTPVVVRVIDAETEAPMRGATVSFKEEGERIDLEPTGEDGAFRVPGIEEGSRCWVKARAPGHCAASDCVDVEEGRPEPAVLVLRMKRGGTLTGVVRTEGGAAAAGARVLVRERFTFSDWAPQTLEERIAHYEFGDERYERYEFHDDIHAVTDGDGTFRADGLEFGALYEVTARAPGHSVSEAVSGVWVTEAEPVGTACLALRPRCRVLLRVVMPRGQALPGEPRIRVFQQEGFHEPGGRDAEGRFWFDAVDPGLVHGYAEVAGHPCDAVPIQVEAGATVEAEIRLKEGCRVTGSVVGPDGKPVEGVKVRAAPVRLNPPEDGDGVFMLGDREADTDEGGRFEIVGLLPGETFVAAKDYRGDGQSPERVRVTAPASGVRLKLVRRGGFRLRLVEPSGVPHTGKVEIRLDRVNEGSYLRRNGRRGVVGHRDLEDGDYTFWVTPRGYAWFERTVRIRDGATVDLGDVILEKGVTVSGRVVDETGAPVEGATIYCAGEATRRTESDEDGRFSMDHVPDGGFALRGWARGYEWREPVDVKPAATTGLRVVVRRSAHLTGHVRNADGSNAGEVLVDFRKPGARKKGEEELWWDFKRRMVAEYEGSHWAFTDSAGRIDSHVMPGTYTAYWTDESGKEHRLAAWTFEAAKTHKLKVVLPAK